MDFCFRIEPFFMRKMLQAIFCLFAIVRASKILLHQMYFSDFEICVALLSNRLSPNQQITNEFR